MGGQEGDRSLDREAANYYRLGNLLRKERSDMKARLVQAVSQENIPIEEKISRINAIDLRPEGDLDPRGAAPHRVRHLDHPIVSKRPRAEAMAERPPKVVPEKDETKVPGGAVSAGPIAPPATGAAPAPGGAAPPAAMSPARNPAVALSAAERREARARFTAEVAPANPALQLSSRARLRAMREPEHGGLINFIFSDFWKIRKFGTESRTLEPGSWPFTLHVAPAVPVFLQQTLRSDGLENLKEVLTPILKKGWMFLDKLEYNQLAALMQVVGVAQRMECRQVKGKNEAILPSFSGMGSMVHVFNVDPTLPNQVCSLLGRVCERSGVGDQERVKAIATIRLLLDCRDSGLTVPNLIRAVWMHHTHRYLDPGDLSLIDGPAGNKPRTGGDAAVRSELVRFFSTAGFDCSAEVQMDIDRHIAQLVTRLDLLDVERVDIARWRSFLPPPTGDKPFGPIQDNRRPQLSKVDFAVLGGFYQGHPAHTDYVFMVDRSMPLLLLVRFLDLFLTVFGPLLVSGIKAGGARQEILQRGLLAAQFTKLEFLHERLQEAVVAMPHLGNLRYADLLNETVGGTDAETLMVARIKELATVLIAVGKAVADIIKNRSALASPVMRAGHAEEPAYPLPAEALEIQSADGLNGRSVLDALVLATQVSLQAGFYLCDGELDLVFKRETELAGQLQPLRESLERMTSDDQLAFLRSAYPTILGA